MDFHLLLLLLKLSTGAETLLIAVIIYFVLPSILKKRRVSSFYSRLAITYVLIMVGVLARFLDFLETTVLQQLVAKEKAKWQNYCLGTLVNMYNMSLVGLGVELCLLLFSSPTSGQGLWVVFSSITAGLPTLSLLITITIWETSEVIVVKYWAAAVRLLCGLALTALAVVVAVIARRRRASLGEDAVARVKMFLLMMATLAVALAADLLLDLASRDMVINDLIYSIASLVLCACHLLVQPGHPAASHLLPCLDHRVAGATEVSNIKATILQEEGDRPRSNLEEGQQE